MILDHVAQRSGLIVIFAAVFHAERLGYGDLDVVDVATIPDGFEEGVGKTEGQDVLDSFLTQKVVDAVNLEIPRAFRAGIG